MNLRLGFRSHPELRHPEITRKFSILESAGTQVFRSQSEFRVPGNNSQSTGTPGSKVIRNSGFPESHHAFRVTPGKRSIGKTDFGRHWEQRFPYNSGNPEFRVTLGLIFRGPGLNRKSVRLKSSGTPGSRTHPELRVS